MKLGSKMYSAKQNDNYRPYDLYRLGVGRTPFYIYPNNAMNLKTCVALVYNKFK